MGLNILYLITIFTARDRSLRRDSNILDAYTLWMYSKETDIFVGQSTDPSTIVKLFVYRSQSLRILTYTGPSGNQMRRYTKLFNRRLCDLTTRIYLWKRRKGFY